MHQKNIFMAQEGNEWYWRNKTSIQEKSQARNPIIKVLEYLDGASGRALCNAMCWTHRPTPYKTFTMVNVCSI